MRRHTWVPYAAALAGSALLVKGVLAAAQGDRAPDAATGVLYLGGIGLGVLAAVGAGLRQRGRLRGTAVGSGLALLLVGWIVGLGEVVEPLIAALSDDVDVREETPIALAGLVVLLLAWRAWSRDTGAAPAARA